MFQYTVEIEREDDGRWIAEVAELPGVMAYGQTQQEAASRVQALALRVLADKLEEQPRSELPMTVSFAGA